MGEHKRYLKDRLAAVGAFEQRNGFDKYDSTQPVPYIQNVVRGYLTGVVSTQDFPFDKQHSSAQVVAEILRVAHYLATEESSHYKLSPSEELPDQERIFYLLVVLLKQSESLTTSGRDHKKLFRSQYKKEINQGLAFAQDIPIYHPTVAKADSLAIGPGNQILTLSAASRVVLRMILNGDFKQSVR